MGEAVGAATIDLEWVQAEVDSWEVVALSGGMLTMDHDELL